MNTSTRNTPVFVLVTFLTLIVLVTSACSFFTPNLVGGFSQTVDITLDEKSPAYPAPHAPDK